MYDLLDESGLDKVRIAVAGDWATGTDEAESVAEQMKAFKPHFTIHLGDVYYVGDPPEVSENCLGVKNPNNNYDPIVWPIGSVGSFALNGNHEMYANGGGYFDLLLPNLGLQSATLGVMAGQQTSFFCLQNRYWRTVGIDTGYNSTGLPILSGIPLVNKIPGVGPTCALPDSLMEWLTNIVVPNQDARGLVMLSHHQYFSGFEDGYTKPARQLWDAGVQRNVLWFWGHEHRLAGYDLYGSEDLKAFGRCIGHGGMPLELGDPDPDREPAPTFYDNRPGDKGFGVNGHVNLNFDGPNLQAEYVDLKGQPLIQENWSVDSNGNIMLMSRQKLINDAGFHSNF
ncbi:MAG TPA: metallophosphoesterase [Terriglobales bacterium]|nr:metallophosphoesterase [Terriglobales bacterium]